MKLILRYLRRHLGIFLTSLFFLSVEAAADLLQPTFMARIVDRGVKSADTGEILRCGAVMLAIAAAGALGAVMRNLFASRTSQTIAMELRGDLYRKIQTLSLENIDHLQPAALITRITNDVTQIQEFINGSMRIMIKAPLTCAGAVTLIILQTPQQIPVMIVILVIAAGLIAGNMPSPAAGKREVSTVFRRQTEASPPLPPFCAARFRQSGKNFCGAGQRSGLFNYF